MPLQAPHVSERKQKLIQSAVRLMLRQGYAATSIDQICADAGVTKGSFFHYFTTKDAVCRVAVDAWASAWKQILAKANFEELGDPLDRLERLFAIMGEIYIDSPVDTGCLIGTVAQEVSPANRELGEWCQIYLDGWARYVARMLADAKQSHQPVIDFGPDSVADFILGVVQGSFLVGRTRADRAVITNNLGHCRAYVRSLFGLAQ